MTIRTRTQTSFEKFRLGASEAFSRATKILLCLVHSVIAVLLLVLAIWFLWRNVLDPLQPDRTIVRTIGLGEVVTAPQCGHFHRRPGLQHGAFVHEGDVIGEVRQGSLLRERAQLEAKIALLKLALLRHDQQADLADDLSTAAHSAQVNNELVVRLQLVESRFALVSGELAELTLRVPIDGVVRFTEPDHHPVDRDVAVAEVWPIDSNREILIEVDGPLEGVLSLLRRHTVHCEFDSAQRRSVAEAVPLASTFAAYHVDDVGRHRKQARATLRCRPVNLPRELHQPGLVGSVRR